MLKKKKIPTEKAAVVITGMHRSGTSALAQCLGNLGLALPQDVMPARADNSTGFWESLAVVRLNNAILEKLKSPWDRPVYFQARGQPLIESHGDAAETIAESYCSAAGDALTEVFGDARHICLKDPRITLNIPLWRQATIGAGFRPGMILVHRNPLSVAQSLRARNGLSIARGLQLWLRYNVDALSAALDQPFIAVVDYDHLIEQPEVEIERLCAALGGAGITTIPDGVPDAIDCIDENSRHQAGVISTVHTSYAVPKLVREMAALLEDWPGLDQDERRARFDPIRQEFMEFTKLAGLVGAAPKKIARPQPDMRTPQVQQNRKVILHYHLFKNAGSSLDEILKRNFGEHWTEQEFSSPPQGASNSDLVAQAILDRPEIVVLSSHTALLPVPEIAGVEIFPIIFLRHPIDRLKSAYNFECKQKSDSYGAKLAKKTDFSGYVKTRNAVKTDRTCQNFQAYRLAYSAPDSITDEAERARSAIDLLPFIGIVDDFDRSLELLKEWLEPHFPGFDVFSVRKNVSQAHGLSLDERLQDVRACMSEDDYVALVNANTIDQEIYDLVRENNKMVEDDLGKKPDESVS